MKRIYIYFLSIFAFMSMALTANAAEKEAMNVMNDEMNISSTQLATLKNITFSGTQMLIHLENGSVIKHDFSNFDNVIFGEYISFVGLDEVPSENIEFNVYLSEDKLLSVSSSSIINSLQLVDLSGKIIKINLSGTESNKVKVSVESLSIGLYIVLAHTEDGVKTSKIIIK